MSLISKCENCKKLKQRPLKFTIFAGERNSELNKESINPFEKYFESAKDEINALFLILLFIEG